MDTYQINLVGLLGLCAALFLTQRSKTSPTQDGSSKSKQDRPKSSASQSAFLVVYALVMGADWLQGPFLYSLYTDEHGIPSSLVSTLFTSGFVSGAVSGSFVGSVADQRGRKAACMFFCIAYATSCLLTTLPRLPLLFVGRVLGGLSTSLLFSVFESWMVTDFHARGLAAQGGDLGRTFGQMSTINSVVAILSGVGSEWLVSATGTRKAPFVTSAALLSAALWVIWSQWDENYGETGAAASKTKGAAPKKPAENRVWSILSNPKVLSLGLASTMFEGSMYLFVFFWAPALKSVKSSSGELPYGIIFASFMAAMMASSLTFGAITEKRLLRYTSLLLAIMGTATLCFFLLVRPNSEQPTFWIFCLFEATVGMYWPCMGYLKGRLIEDGIRAQVYSILRVPLNLFVVLSLLVTGDGDAFGMVFTTCSTLLLASTGALWATILTKDAP
ncbi:DUF791-domain-containing protein [Thozetella sp. PMI_491]|nr:DUF791-domain-containing protein [Thozetella sp. PMI_491]